MHPLNCCKPLLMFYRKPTSKDRRRIAEAKKYYPGVVVIFNEKAYANTTSIVLHLKTMEGYIGCAVEVHDRQGDKVCRSSVWVKEGRKSVARAKTAPKKTCKNEETRRIQSVSAYKA
jgi:hypothetical protein